MNAAPGTSEKSPQWGQVKLNDGRLLPEIAFGSWHSGSGATVTEQVEQAIEVGFSHIDTAQSYGNETEVGAGLRESGLSRKDVWLTTKWSGKDGKGITQSINESLTNLGLSYVDLYLIHSPRLTKGDTPGAWRQFEQLKKDGLAKSIGVSNFGIKDLEEIRLAGGQTPSVNQILLHPYVLQKTLPLLLYHAQHGIVTEAYSALIPVTTNPGGPVDAPLKKIAERENIEVAEVLFAWARSKGAVIITASRQEDRLRSYLHAGQVVLSADDIESIDEAAAQKSQCAMGQLIRRAHSAQSIFLMIFMLVLMACLRVAYHF